MIIKLILLVLTFGISLCFESDNVIVKTSSGLVEGNTVTVLNKTINQFLGIPYAEPPLNTLRFAKPQPLQKPASVKIDATKPKNSCFQTKYLTEKIGPDFKNLKESEDCLVLNIWSPELTINITKSSLKPVMFWIYGGGFMIGSIFQLPKYDGRVLATNDVVVVSANYRVGVFGFLYGGGESAPGNVGHFDQILALKWVKQNIDLFGGDPNLITIFGESAGSVSVGALILSPLSKNLFKRAILQSGATFGYKERGRITKDEALNEAKKMGQSFNCSDDNQWLDCLRKVDALKLSSYLNITFTTIEETEFLPFSAQNTLKRENLRKEIEILSGVTKNEGTLLAYMIFEKLTQTLTKTDIINLMKALPNPGIDVEKASEYYLSNIDQTNQTALIQAFGAFYGDLILTCPTYLFAQQFAEYSHEDSVYFYELTHRRNDTSLYACGPEWMGVCHGADLEFVFGVPFLRPDIRSDSDRNFSKLVMKLWTNFAKTGNPLSNNSTFYWPSFKKSSENATISEVMELNPHTFGHLLYNPFPNCDKFWKKYFV